MSPSPLDPSSVHVLLQYISPPSQLIHPLPPHLLSRSLLQRHHFLHISPDEPADYLCWPSSPEHQAELIAALEACPAPQEDIHPPSYPIQYSFDGEDYLAHVSVSTTGSAGPRLILRWEDGEGWKYHNLELMPFPPGSKANLRDLNRSPFSNALTLPVPAFAPSYSDGLGGEGFHLSDDDEDDYWNAYGSQDNDLGDSDGPNVPSAKDVNSSEDAYWAQYASVQGTADSTIPSPVPPFRAKHPPPPLDLTDSNTETLSPHPLPVPVRAMSEDHYAEPLPIPAGMMERPNIPSKWAPASPNTLSRLLSTISPRESPLPTAALGCGFDAEASDITSPTMGGSDDGSDLSGSSGLGLQGIDNTKEERPLAASSALTEGTELESRLNEVNEARLDVMGLEELEEDEADLRNALEGVWQLWKKARRRTGNGAGEESDKDVFMRTVQRVLGRQ